MKYVLFLLAMVSLALSPATASEACPAEMEMSVSDHGVEVSAAAISMDCCEIPNEMSDICAAQCAVTCVSLLTGIAAPFGAQEFGETGLLHDSSASTNLLTHSIAFEPPPPRI